MDNTALWAHAGPAAFTQGLGIGLGLIMAIGAQNAFLLRQGLRREHVATVVVLYVAADATLIAAGVFGMAQVLASQPVLAQALTVAGVIFLSWYALSAARRSLHPQALSAHASKQPQSRWAVLGQAAAMTFLNPHVYLDTVLLVGSVGGQQPPQAQPWFVAGSSLGSLMWFSAVGFSASKLAPWLSRPQAWRVIDGLVAVLMGSLALGLAWTLVSPLLA